MPGLISIYTWTSTEVVAEVEFGKSFPNGIGAGFVPTSVDHPSGTMHIQLLLFGQSGTGVEFAIVSTGETITSKAEASGTSTFVVGPMQNNADMDIGDMDGTTCTTGGSRVRKAQASKLVGQVMRGSALIEADGSAIVDVISYGPYSWYDSGGRRSVVTLPAVQGGFPFGDCAVGAGEVQGAWTAPALFDLRADVPAQLNVDA